MSWLRLRLRHGPYHRPPAGDPRPLNQLGSRGRIPVRITAHRSRRRRTWTGELTRDNPYRSVRSYIPQKGRSWLCTIRDFCQGGMLLVGTGGTRSLLATGAEPRAGDPLNLHFSVPTPQGEQHFRMQALISRVLDSGNGMGIRFPSPLQPKAFEVLMDFAVASGMVDEQRRGSCAWPQAASRSRREPRRKVPARFPKLSCAIGASATRTPRTVKEQLRRDHDARSQSSFQVVLRKVRPRSAAESARRRHERRSDDVFRRSRSARKTARFDPREIRPRGHEPDRSDLGSRVGARETAPPRGREQS